MSRFARILEHPSRILAMTGLSIELFREFLPYFTQSYEGYLEHFTIEGYPREGRRYTSYKNSPLPSMEEKLLFILIYLKQNLNQEVQGQIFDMTQSNVSKWSKLLLKTLNLALAEQNLLPARTTNELSCLLDDMSSSLGKQPLFFKTEPSDQSIGLSHETIRDSITVENRMNML